MHAKVKLSYRHINLSLLCLCFTCSLKSTSCTSSRESIINRDLQWIFVVFKADWQVETHKSNRSDRKQVSYLLPYALPVRMNFLIEHTVAIRARIQKMYVDTSTPLLQPGPLGTEVILPLPQYIFSSLHTYITHPLTFPLSHTVTRYYTTLRHTPWGLRP